MSAPLPRAKRTLSMTSTLVLSFGLLVAISVVSVLGLGLWSAVENTVTLSRDKMQLVSSMIVYRIRRHMAPARTQVDYVTDAIARGITRPEDRKTFERYLNGSMAGVPQIRALVFIDTNYQLFGVGRFEGRVRGYAVDLAKEPAGRQVINRARRMTGPEWAEIVWAGSFKESLINLRAPVRRDGKFIGVLVALVGVAELSEYLDTINEATESTTFILQGRDHVLAHTNLIRGYKGLSPTNPFAQAGRLRRPGAGLDLGHAPAPRIAAPARGAVQEPPHRARRRRVHLRLSDYQGIQRQAVDRRQIYRP